MTNALILLYILLFLLSILLILQGYQLYHAYRTNLTRRRRWGRIKVPNEKMITCRIAEPAELASDFEYLVNDINMAGLSLYSEKKIDKIIVRLQIKFPFTSFKEAASVWGRIAYCNKLADSEKYRVGIAYIRKIKWSK